MTSNKSFIEPVCMSNDFVYTLFEHIYGAKLYIPIDERLLIVKGYFKKDYLQYASSTYNFIYKKCTDIGNILMNYTSIPITFKMNYLKRAQLQMIVLLDETQIVNKIHKHYKLLEKYRQKTITNIIKDFLNASVEEKILLLRLFLLDSMVKVASE